jgi:hypothetical protein
MEQLFSLANLDKLSAFAVLVLVAVLVITEKLVWHTRVARDLKREQDRADRWERVALDALSAGAQAGVKAAEVAVGVVSSIPDPQQVRNDAAAYRNRTGGPL